MVVPFVMVVRMPVNESMVATAVLLLVHTPPEVVSENVADNHKHSESGPMIGPGNGLTQTSKVLKQPVGRV